MGTRRACKGQGRERALLAAEGGSSADSRRGFSGLGLQLLGARRVNGWDPWWLVHVRGAREGRRREREGWLVLGGCVWSAERRERPGPSGWFRQREHHSVVLRRLRRPSRIVWRLLVRWGSL